MVANKPESSPPPASGAGHNLKDNSNSQLFARKLRELRIRAGLTQEQFAEAAFCSSDHVNKMERGLRLPSPQLLQTMLNAFQKAALDPALLDELEKLHLACRFGDNTPAAPPIPAQPAGVPTAAAEPANTASQLFGRAESIQRLVELYRTGQASRLVIISGLGGMGKTAVAAEIAAQVQPLFGGVIRQNARVTQLQNGSVIMALEPGEWQRFSPEYTFEGLVSFLARHFQASGSDPEAAVSEVLGRDKFLIVLDSLEECTEPAQLLTGLERLLGQSGSRVIITSRFVPPNFEGYHLHLGALEPDPAVEFFRQEGLRRNLPPLMEESPEVRLVLQSAIEHSGGHPLAMKFIAHRLGTFSLTRILEDLGRNYQDMTALANHPAGGLYRYLYRAEWLSLSEAARELILKMKEWPGKIEESRLVKLGGPDMDFALAELVAANMVEVRGGFVKNYALHPLTFNLLKTGLTALWEQEAGL